MKCESIGLEFKIYELIQQHKNETTTTQKKTQQKQQMKPCIVFQITHIRIHKLVKLKHLEF